MVSFANQDNEITIFDAPVKNEMFIHIRKSTVPRDSIHKR